VQDAKLWRVRLQVIQSHFQGPAQVSTIGSESQPIRSPLGVIGLGYMGTVITERFLEHGYPVHVWNRSKHKAGPLIRQGALWSDNPLADCQRVIVSLYSSNVVAEALSLFESALKPSQIIIDTTTGEPQDCEALAARLKKGGAVYLDAPISGSSLQTRQGEAVVMVGGPRDAYAECADVWKVLGRSVFYTGPTGSASRMKLVSNLILGLNRVALAEGLAYARAIGVDPAAALEILKASAAYSKVMDVKGAKMLAADFTTQARLSQHLKDVRIILKSAAEAGMPLPMSQTHAALLEQAEAEGLGDLDNSAIASVYRGTTDAGKDR
jgi:3-hydroxyisobutyrate dehydrogenase-like beta-hydroxyacid dehydrogenase